MRVRITSYGKLFLVILITMLAATLNYNNSLVYLLVFIMFSLFILSCFKGWLNLYQLQLSDLSLGSTFAHSTLPVTGVIRPGQRLNSTFIDLSIQANGDLSEVSIDELNSPQTFELSYSPVRRGRFRLEHAEVSSRYPLGLFHWSKTLEVGRPEAWIYPEPIDFGLAPQQSKPGKTEEALDFDELTSWQPGEGLSGICWKTYARTGTKMKKQFIRPGDTSSSLFDWSALDKLSDEQKLSQLCYWVVEKHQAGELFGLNIPNGFLDCASGTEHFHQCLRVLAAFGLHSQHSDSHV